MIYSKIIFITLFVFLTACGGGSTGGGNVPIVDERPTIPSSVDETLEDINTLLDDLGL